MANNRRKSKTSFTGGLLGIVMLVGLLMVIWFMVKGIFSILSFVAPVLFIITLFLKRSVVIDYGKFIIDTFKKNAGMGLLYGIGTFVGFPLVVAYLFVKALMLYNVEKRFSKKDPKFAEYEEVEEQEVDDEDFLDLPEIEKAEPIKRSSSNEYEDLL